METCFSGCWLPHYKVHYCLILLVYLPLCLLYATEIFSAVNSIIISSYLSQFNFDAQHVFLLNVNVLAVIYLRNCAITRNLRSPYDVNGAFLTFRCHPDEQHTLISRNYKFTSLFEWRKVSPGRHLFLLRCVHTLRSRLAIL